jgi:hypothetical protein
MVPLVGERIERYWEYSDFDTYYRIWNHYMNTSGANDIMNNGQYISWVVHDEPEYLLARFPNCKIIHLKDPANVVERYLETTALFPIAIHNPLLKPKYLNDFAQDLEELFITNSNPTHRDYWAWSRFNASHFPDELKTPYRLSVTRMINNPQKNTPGVLNVSWDDLDINSIKEYLNSNSIDSQYEKLTSSR